MHLIVGLGNPGAKYANHRHNVGAMAIDEIASRFDFPPFRSRFRGLFSDGRIESERVLLLKPQTYMNNSGESVYAALKFFKLQASDITVIYDELDLKPGKVRVKSGGGNNGHNGLRSIDPRIGTRYQRVRIGIGRPGQKQQVNSHVLSPFHKSERQWLDPLLAAIAQNALLLVRGDAATFMNRVSLVLQGKEQEAGTGTGGAPSPKNETKNASLSDNRPAGSSSRMSDMLKKLFNKE